MTNGRKYLVAAAGLLAIGAAIAFFMPRTDQPSNRPAEESVQTNGMAAQSAVANRSHGPDRLHPRRQPGESLSAARVRGGRDALGDSPTQRAAAMHSISTLAPTGKALTASAVRAGGSLGK